MILMSIKKKYTDLIYTGQKTIELRKKLIKHWNIHNNNIIFIYEPKPIQCITGSINLLSYEQANYKRLLMCKDGMCLTEKQIKKYLGTQEYAYMLWILSFYKFIKPIPLEAILRVNNKFHPPQSFYYINACNPVVKLIKKYNGRY